MPPAVRRFASLKGVDWGPVVRVVERERAFALVTHVRPDTDGVGSEVALERHLRRAGKDVRILNPEPMPERLSVLDPEGVVRVFRPADAAFLRSAAIFVLDVSERERLGPVAADVKVHPGASVCIDHHVNEQRRFATLNVIEPEAPSTGVLVCELLQELGAELDATMARALYATILADTGSFRFSNTTSETMRLAADLVDLGADPPRIHRAVLGSYSRQKMQLLAGTLAGCGLECDGRLAWYALSQERIRLAQATEQDADGLVEYLRLLSGVRAAILLVEQADRQVKVSFRSEDGIDVNRLATRWGGGGHRHASGAMIPGSLDHVVREVLGAAKTSLFPP